MQLNVHIGNMKILNVTILLPQSKLFPFTLEIYFNIHTQHNVFVCVCVFMYVCPFLLHGLIDGDAKMDG